MAIYIASSPACNLVRVQCKYLATSFDSLLIFDWPPSPEHFPVYIRPTILRLSFHGHASDGSLRMCAMTVYALHVSHLLYSLLRRYTPTINGQYSAVPGLPPSLAAATTVTVALQLYKLVGQSLATLGPSLFRSPKQLAGSCIQVRQKPHVSYPARRFSQPGHRRQQPPAAIARLPR